MGWFDELRYELRARRRGRRHAVSSLPKAAREVIGPTGWNWSRSWDAMAGGSDAYVRSFDRRLPPSEFVSARDRLRANIPIPVVERCLEDRGRDESPDRPSRFRHGPAGECPRRSG